MGFKSLEGDFFFFFMHTFSAKRSPDVEIPPVLLGVFTVACGKVIKGGNVRNLLLCLLTVYGIEI